MDTTKAQMDLLRVFLPEELSAHFEVKEVTEKKGYIRIRLDELPGLIPEQIKGLAGVVLDGFCNPLELQSFPLKGKPVYLHVYRRRWKYGGSSKHFSNIYDLNPEGVKATKEFAAFLKEAYGQTPDQYNSYICGIVR